MSDIPYVRIGTSYYKIVQVPTLNNQFNESLIKWDVTTIIQDHGRKYLDDIPKYNGKICFPNHFKFSKEIHGFYNTYSPLKHSPKKGKIDNTLAFFKHIFGNFNAKGNRVVPFIEARLKVLEFVYKHMISKR